MNGYNLTLPLGALFSEDAPFPCFLIDPETHEIRWFNEMVQNWTGMSKRRLERETLWALLSIDEGAQNSMLSAYARGAAVTVRDAEIYLPNAAEDEALICHMSAFPTQGHIGVGFRFAKKHPRKAKIGGQVVSGMGRLIAHELKNPLAGIKGAAQLLSDDVKSDEGQALINLIVSEIDRIRRLADRMETLGDQDPETTDHVNIHEILRRARQIIQSADNQLAFTESYDPSLPHVAGDADTLMQAILNLIKNAGEAGQQITLKTKFRSGVSARGEGNSVSLPVEIQIIDDGPGIPPDLIDQVFQPFMSTKNDGQGLGLALVSKVASAHGGVVEVQSRPGHTKFSLLLPAPIALPDDEAAR